MAARSRPFLFRVVVVVGLILILYGFLGVSYGGCLEPNPKCGPAVLRDLEFGAMVITGLVVLVAGALLLRSSRAATR